MVLQIGESVDKQSRNFVLCQKPVAAVEDERPDLIEMDEKIRSFETRH